MMNKIDIKFSYNEPHNPICVNAKLNNIIFFDEKIDKTKYNISFLFDDVPYNHLLEFELSNKTDIHKSAQIYITDISINEMSILHIIENFGIYNHVCNTNNKYTANPFSKILGYNGIVNFNFTTPIHLQSLEWIQQSYTRW